MHIDALIPRERNLVATHSATRDAATVAAVLGTDVKTAVTIRE